jgi:methyl-accepting chemotaxis protein
MLHGNNNREEFTMKTTTILSAVLALALVGGMSACTRRDESMGPAQEAGKKIDNVGDKVAKDLHDKLDKANQAAKDAAKSAQDTADKINDATADAAKGLNKATEEVGKKVERAGEKMQEAAKK